MDTRKMLTNDELQKSLKNEKKFIDEVMNKYKDMDRVGIDGLFKTEIELILNQVLNINYEVMKKCMKKEDPLFKLMFLEHEKIYCFMLKYKLKVSVKWEDDEFLQSVEYPLRNLEL